jgi:maltose alpha-D-glucosyltransferase/alpha-amylase
MDPIYGYQVVNVEAQLSDQSSLLHWTRNMIALRKLFQVFGRGTLEFLHPENRKILAYLRRLKRDDDSEEIVLCVANLSRFAQPVSLDLAPYSGMMPVEMLGYVSFPQIGSQPYPLTVAPYSFLWFELQPAPAHIAESTDERQIHEQGEEVALELLATGWSALASGRGLELLQTALPQWLLRQRFFGAKTKTITSIGVIDFAAIPLAASTAQTPEPQGTQLPTADSLGAAIFFISIRYSEGDPDTYQIPLALSTGREAEGIQANAPNSVLTTLTTSAGQAILHDAVIREDFRQSLLKIIEDDRKLALSQPPSAPLVEDLADVATLGPRDAGAASAPAEPAPAGELRGCHSSVFAKARGTQPVPARTGSAEQSNTSILYDHKMILKLFRRLQPGQNPDVEIGRFLTEVARFPRIAPFLGDLSVGSANGETTAIAMLQELVENEGDGWAWTLEELARFYESVASCPPPKDEGEAATFLSEGRIPPDANERAWLYIAAAGLLGKRTAEMHLALATETEDDAFKAQPLSEADLLADTHRIDAQINRTLDALKLRMSTLVNETADDAGTILSRRIELFARAHSIASTKPSGKAIRIHGDYHLGQVLHAKNDFILLDFEGEPARSLEERRRKQCPLKDVAGMLRSFSYAAWSGLDQYVQRHPDSQRALEPWLRLWQNSVSTAFLNAYRQAFAGRPDLLPEPTQAQSLLNAYLLEKSLYELLYELNNRPAWVRIPLAGILSLPAQNSTEEAR